VLDLTPSAKETLRSVETLLAVSRIDLVPQAPPSARELRSEKHSRPTVTEWLRAFQVASLIITDSFHGTIFAVLNHKPFIVMANSARGVSRLSSLLNMLGLERRLIESTTNRDAAHISRILQEPIDWSEVDSRIEHQRQRALAFLASELG